jgi:hypothetical protein
MNSVEQVEKMGDVETSEKIKLFKVACKMGTPSYRMPWEIYEIIQMIEAMDADEWSETFDVWYLAVSMTHMKELSLCTTKEDDMLFKSINQRINLWNEQSSRFGKITNTRAKAGAKNKGVDVIRIFDKGK